MSIEQYVLNTWKPEDWKAEPFWFNQPIKNSYGRKRNASEDYGVSLFDKGLRFSVNDFAKMMAWSCQLQEPVSTVERKYVVIQYRAVPFSRSGDYCIYLIGRKPEAGSESDQASIVFNDFIDDGQLHRIVKEAPHMTVDQMSVKVCSGMKRAGIDLESITFASERPVIRLSDYLAICDHGNTSTTEVNSFFTVNIVSLCNASNREKFQVFPFSISWFDSARITVNGIPFNVVMTDPNLAATEIEKHGTISVSVGKEAEAVYLLLAAHFTGMEEPSFGGGELAEVRHVERFVVEILYADGLRDLAFPFNIASREHVIRRGLAVYAVIPSRRVKIDKIILRDFIKQGAFYLAGLTVGKFSSVKSKENEVKYTHLPESGRRAQGAPSIQVRGDEITFGNGTVRCVFDASRGLSIRAMENAYGVNCLKKPSPVFALDIDEKRISSCDFRCVKVEEDNKTVRLVLKHSNVDAEIRLFFNSRDELTVSMSLGNSGEEEVSFIPVFPLVTNLLIGDDISDNFCCFPRRGCVISNLPLTYREPYSGLFPMQFMDVFAPGSGGFFLMIHDLDDNYKWYCMSKSDSSSMSVEYMKATLQPGKTLHLPESVIGGHSGDWHDALMSYKRWVRSWYKPAVPRKKWFRRIFNFRQHFLYLELPKKSGMFNDETKEYHFKEVLERDKSAFGGIDYLHIFDWAMTSEHGRCGDYKQWERLGGADAFRKNIKEIQDTGIPVGLYLEGYLVSPMSDIGKANGEKWQLLNSEGEHYPYFDPDFNICSDVKDWQDYLARTYARVYKKTGANGFYIDQMGFADARHFCYNSAHEHPVPWPPLRGQRDLVRSVRNALPPETAVYTEETPTDVNSQYQDGAFTYAISNYCGDHGDFRRISDDISSVHLNLFRFAFPDFKTFEIIACDKPIGSDCQSVKQIFFNGEGIWLEGTSDEWFAPETRRFIAKMHSILISHEDAFLSMNPMPLVPTLHQDIYANQFPSDTKTVWTLYNAGYSTVRGEFMAIEHVSDSRYFDIWNESDLEFRLDSGLAYITLELGPQDVGCIMQKRVK